MYKIIKKKTTLGYLGLTFKIVDLLKQFRSSKDICMLDFLLDRTYKYGVNFMIAGIYAMENII